MRTLLYFSTLIILLIACDETTNNDASNQETVTDSVETTVVNNETEDTAPPSSEASVEEEEEEDMYATPEGTFTAIYEGATVYTGSTDFQFDVDGKLKLIRIGNDIYYRIEDGEQVEGYDVPGDLIDPSEDLEGVPGGNPKWMGKKFEITTTETTLVIKPIDN